MTYYIVEGINVNIQARQVFHLDKIAIYSISFRSFSRVSPAPDTFPPGISIPTSNGDLQHRHSVESGSQRNTRVSIDLSSKGILSFHHISYIIGGRKPEKQIIQNISGVFRSGMNAIMGKN